MVDVDCAARLTSMPAGLKLSGEPTPDPMLHPASILRESRNL